MIRKIDHIGIAVRSIEDAVRVFVDALGLGDDGREKLDDRELLTAFLRAGDVHIELLESLSDSTPIAKHLAKRGEGMHHIAFEVDDLDETIRRCEAAGLTVIGGPSEGAKGKRIAFLHPKNTHGVLIELSENTSR